MSGDGFLAQPAGFATKSIHSGHKPEDYNCRAVVVPVVLSTTFKQDAPAEHRGFEYGRSGNPTRNTLEACLASLDDAKHGLAFGSGLGATTAITSMLSAGDHIVAGDDLYGGTNRYFQKVVARLGVETSLVDLTNLANVKAALRNNTKMVWLESPTNPLLRVADIAALSALVHEHNKDIIVVVDNTFLTSYFQRPLLLGADIAVYSLTKYMNGHSDVIMGAATLNNDQLHERLRFLQNSMGIVPSPFDCFLVNRSLKTLALRMKQHMASALTIAAFLEKHARVEKVLHPGLPSHPQHELAKRQCYGHSGMLTFFLKGGLEESRIFFKSLKVFSLAESLGGYESLAELPSLMTHASVPYEERVKLGITDNLIRISVGLEDVEDLVADLDRALNCTIRMCAKPFQNPKA